MEKMGYPSYTPAAKAFCSLWQLPAHLTRPSGSVGDCCDLYIEPPYGVWGSYSGEP
ncbi:leukocyte tyrosine kinase receptor [Prionailurus iriomotensis]